MKVKLNTCGFLYLVEREHKNIAIKCILKLAKTDTVFTTRVFNIEGEKVVTWYIFVQVQFFDTLIRKS